MAPALRSSQKSALESSREFDKMPVFRSHPRPFVSGSLKGSTTFCISNIPPQVLVLCSQGKRALLFHTLKLPLEPGLISGLYLSPAFGLRRRQVIPLNSIPKSATASLSAPHGPRRKEWVIITNYRRRNWFGGTDCLAPLASGRGGI